MAALIESAGGEEVSEKNKNQAMLYILDEGKDKKMISSFKGQKNGPNVCGVEVVFDGILQQKFDFKKYSLIK